MKVKNCNDCPFCIDDDYWNVSYCKLQTTSTKKLENIDIFKLYNEVPYFCALKQGALTIELEEINK